MSKTFTAAEVAAHKTPKDLYIIVDEDVYDLTQFQSEHPGLLFVAVFGAVELTFPRRTEEYG